MKFIDTYEEVDYFLRRDDMNTCLLHVTNSVGTIDTRYISKFNVGSLYRIICKKDLTIPFLVDDSRQINTPIIHLGLFDLDNNLKNKGDVQRILYKLRLLCVRKKVDSLVLYRPNIFSAEFEYVDFRRMLSQSFSDTDIVIVCCARKDIA